MTTETTPLPWYVEDDPLSGWTVGVDIMAGSKDDPICVAADVRCRADGDLIVRAVNAHQDLVEGLRRQVRFLDELLKDGRVVRQPLEVAKRDALERLRKACGPCERCDGCGKVADSADQEPWTAWTSLPLNAGVVLGLVRPIDCPACAGWGVKP